MGEFVCTVHFYLLYIITVLYDCTLYICTITARKEQYLIVHKYKSTQVQSTQVQSTTNAHTQVDVSYGYIHRSTIASPAGGENTPAVISQEHDTDPSPPQGNPPAAICTKHNTIRYRTPPVNTGLFLLLIPEERKNKIVEILARTVNSFQTGGVTVQLGEVNRRNPAIHR